MRISIAAAIIRTPRHGGSVETVVPREICRRENIFRKKKNLSGQ